MARELHHLGQVLGRGVRRDLVALGLELRHVDVVHLVAVAVALVHFRAIDGKGQRILFNGTFLRAEAHRAAEVGLLGALLDPAGAVDPLRDQGHDRVRRVLVELGAVGAVEAADVAREFDGRELHAEADAEVRHGVLARKADRAHLAFGAALAEAARYQDRVHLLQPGGAVLLHLLRVDVVDVDLGVGVDPGVPQRLVQRLVGILQVDVLADEGDVDLVLGMLERVHQLGPVRQVGGAGEDAELVADDLVEHLLVQHHRDLVDVVDVPGRDHRLFLHVRKESDFSSLLSGQRLDGAAKQRVSLDADLAQLLHRMLGRLGLDLARRRNIRNKRQVYVANVIATQFQPHLPDRLQERQRLDVADRAAHLDDRHVGIARAALDEGLDLVGDVRDDLHRAAEVVALPLLLDHRLVDLAGGEVVGAAHFRALEALVVAQVQVGLRAVLGDEHLAVLKRRHRPGVDVDVRVQLDVGDADAARFEDRCEGSGGDAFPQ